MQGRFLVAAFGVSLKRSPGSFASGRKKEVRLSLFTLSRPCDTQRHPLASPIKATQAAPVAAFVGLLPEVGVFDEPAATELAAAGVSHGGDVELPENTWGGAAPASEQAEGAEGGEEGMKRGKLHAWSVVGGEVRVNKLALDLERRGKIIAACGGVGGCRQGAKEVSGFLAEFDFLRL